MFFTTKNQIFTENMSFFTKNIFSRKIKTQMADRLGSGIYRREPLVSSARQPAWSKMFRFLILQQNKREPKNPPLKLSGYNYVYSTRC